MEPVGYGSHIKTPSFPLAALDPYFENHGLFSMFKCLIL